ncbi:TnsD family Tn7-like transposition protein [Sporomusa sp. GT1]|uniref:TnsD family Tn7-like transposition protein n=1 Tax=Sporomusa sp. GT1 TaxID=1534747 RepID=UPI00166B5C1C|nr:TnsD family Tn7-like transposition protein [Sporomusa sp. GT1]
MISHFPNPYPDELFYSILSRYHARIGNRSFRITLNELFGSRNVMVSADLPGHISLLAKRLSQFMRYSARELAYNHTLYPFYSPFLPIERATKVLHCMYSDRGGVVHYTAGLMASRIASLLVLRYCPECVSEDRVNFGEAYWHRSHQLPFLPVCWLHETPLSDSGVSAVGSKMDSLVHLEELENLDLLPLNDIAPDIVVWLVKLVSDGVWLLNNPQKPQRLQYFRTRYLDALDHRGLVSRGGKQVDQRLLQDVFLQTYPWQLLQYFGIPLDYDDDHNWLRGMVRKYRKAVHPLFHLLMMRLLWRSMDEFFSTKKRMNSIKETSEAKSNKHGLTEPSILEEKQRQWVVLEKSFPQFGRTELRKHSPALYVWLYRHDPEWLKQRPIEKGRTKTTVQRIDWSDRDIEIYKQAYAWLNQERSLQGKPKRITVTRIAKDLGVRAWIEKHPDKLPLTMSFLKSIAESVERFQIRRINWVAQNMKDEGIRIERWRVCRMAGLRSDLHPEVERALEEILDAMIVGGVYIHAV